MIGRERFEHLGGEGGKGHRLPKLAEGTEAGQGSAEGGIPVAGRQEVAHRLDGVLEAVGLVLDAPQAVAAGARGEGLLHGGAGQGEETLGGPAVDPEGAVGERMGEGEAGEAVEGAGGGRRVAGAGVAAGEHAGEAGGAEGQVGDGGLEQELVEAPGASQVEELVEEHVAGAEEEGGAEGGGETGGRGAAVEALLGEKAFELGGDVGQAPPAGAKQGVEKLEEAGVAADGAEDGREPVGIAATERGQAEEELAGLGGAERAYG